MKILLKKVFAILIILLVHQSSFGQTIIVNGQPSNGKLQWSDFTGKVDKTSTFHAYTAYKYRTKIKSIKPSGDSVIIEGFEVVLELDPSKSWARMKNVSDELLVHEQGHFNFGILTMKEILEQVKQTHFTASNFQVKLQKIVDQVAKKYHEMGRLYDEETKHHMDQQQQLKWNEFFKSVLPELY